MPQNETVYINPLPDKEKFEWEINNVFEKGDIEFAARMLQLGRTSLSKMLSPGEIDRHNPAWLLLGLLWSFDLKGTDQGDRLLRIVGKHRAMWQPRTIVRPDPGKTTAEIGKLSWELLEKELAGADESTTLDAVLKLEEKCKQKSDEIMAMRGLRIAVGESESV